MLPLAHNPSVELFLLAADADILKYSATTTTWCLIFIMPHREERNALARGTEHAILSSFVFRIHTCRHHARGKRRN